jgi:DNA-binding CsgD family transcriptional regulator
MDILMLVTEGLTNREIAFKLKVSVYTVETHLRMIYAKIHARGRAHAAAWYVKHMIDNLHGERSLPENS